LEHIQTLPHVEAPRLASWKVAGATDLRKQ
jgi:hypothetical protein